MLAADDLRPLFPATLAGLILGAGQTLAIVNALEGSSLAAVVAWVLAAALGALVVVASASAPEGAARRVAESAVVGGAVWLAVEYGTAERLDGFGLDHAAGLGAAAAFALAGRAPGRIAVRLTAAAAVLGTGLLLDDRGALADVGLILPIAVVPAVVLVDGAYDLAGRRRLLPAALVVALPAVAAAVGLVVNLWEDERERRAAFEATQPPPARVGQERIAWTFAAPDFYSGPLVAGDVVVADAQNGVWGLDAETGAKRWRAKVPGRDAIPEPVVDGDLLLYPANLAGLFALEAESGRQRWRFRRAETQLWGAAVAGSVVVAGAWGDRGPGLLGLRRSDGRLMWERGIVGDRFELTAGEAGVRLDIGSDGWTVDPGTGRLTPAAPRRALDYTYGDFSALRSRKHGWKYRPGWDASTSEPVEADGVTYVTVRLDPPKLNGGLYALDAATGKLRWRVEIAGDALHRPAVRGSLVYATGVGNCTSEERCHARLYAVRR